LIQFVESLVVAITGVVSETHDVQGDVGEAFEIRCIVNMTRLRSAIGNGQAPPPCVARPAPA
jgi:hypothetical protein